MKITATLLRKISETATSLANQSDKNTTINEQKATLKREYKERVQALNAKEKATSLREREETLSRREAVLKSKEAGQ